MKIFSSIKAYVNEKRGITKLRKDIDYLNLLVADLKSENTRLSKAFSGKFEASFDMHAVRGTNSRLILLSSVRGGTCYTVDFDASSSGLGEIRNLLLSIFGREWPEIHVVDAPRFIRDEISYMGRPYR